MGAAQDTSTADATQSSNLPPHYEDDATFNPRDIKSPPLSPEQFDSLWRETAPADNSGQANDNEPAASAAPTPADSNTTDTATSDVSTDGNDSTDTAKSAAAYDAAAQCVKTQNSQTCAQAALMLNAQGGGEPVPDQVLADRFRVPASVVAENRDQFRYAYNRIVSLRALDQCSVLPGLVVANPQAASAVSHDLLSWSTVDGLLSETGHALKEVAGGVVEPILHMATGLVAQPVSDVAGLAATAYEAASDEDNSQSIDGFMQHVRNAWTYQPRTEAGASPVNPLNSIPTFLGMLLNFALPNKADDGDTAGGAFRNGVREAIPQALGIAAAKVPLVPKALREGDVSGIDSEAPSTPNPDLSPAGSDTPPETGEHPPPRLAPQAQADLVQSIRTASNIDRVSQLLKGNQLCEENPALCATFLQKMAAGGDMQTLYVPRDAIEQMAQSRGTTSQALLDQMPETKANGGLLAIPAHEYFTALPDGMAADLAPFAKPSRGTSSLAETLAQAKRGAASMGAAADATAPSESQNAVEAASEADAASSAENAQPGDSQTTAATPSGHPLANPEEWAGYQKELQGMSPENRAMAERFADKLRDYHAAVAEYATLDDSHGGKVLNTDIARELSPDYLKDRAKSEVIQHLASAFVRKMYAEKLAATREPMVLFSAGGPGAGKSTVLGELPALAKASANADIIYDTTMSHYDSARGMIEQALKAGGGVRIVLVIREPTDALLNGVIRRAVDEEKKFGSGRTVALDYFLNAHPSAIRNVFRLAEEYRNYPEIRFDFVDNTHGKDDIREVSMEQAKQIEFQQVEERARKILEQEYRDGRISEKVYKGFKFGKDVP